MLIITIGLVCVLLSCIVVGLFKFWIAIEHMRISMAENKPISWKVSVGFDVLLFGIALFALFQTAWRVL